MSDALSYVSDCEKTVWFVVGFMVAWFVLQGTWPRRSWTYSWLVLFLCLFGGRSVFAQSAASGSTTQPGFLGLVQSETPVAQLVYWYGSGVAGVSVATDSNISGANTNAYDPWVVFCGSVAAIPNLYATEQSSPPFSLLTMLAHSPAASWSDYSKNYVSVNVSLVDYGSYYEGSVPLLRAPVCTPYTYSSPPGQPAATLTGYTVTASLETTLTVHLDKSASYVVLEGPAVGNVKIYLSGVAGTSASQLVGTSYIYANGSSSGVISPSPALALGGSFGTLANGLPPAYWGYVEVSGVGLSAAVATTGPTTTPSSQPTTQGSWLDTLSSNVVGTVDDNGKPDPNSLYSKAKGQVTGAFDQPDIDASHDYSLDAFQTSSDGTMDPSKMSSDSQAVSDMQSVVNWVVPNSLGSDGPFQTSSISFAGQQGISVPPSLWSVASPVAFMTQLVTAWVSFKKQYSVAFAALRVIGTGIFAWNFVLSLFRLWCWAFHVDAAELLKYLYVDMSDLPSVTSQDVAFSDGALDDFGESDALLDVY